jgi:thiamine-phosphate pyrophosphorylase
VILYYITDRKQFTGSESERCRRLLEKIAEAAQYGVDFVQLREKDLPTRELELLAREAVRLLENATTAGSRPARRMTRLLVNSRIDVALAAGAHGVHLRSDDISAGEARAIWAGCAVYGQARPAPVIAVSCHRSEAVRAAAGNGADFAVFAPVFEKQGIPGVGLEALLRSRAPQVGPGNVEGSGTSQFPVLALGGVTLENAGQCLQAGARGIAAIRLFQENSIGSVLETLRRRQDPVSTRHSAD